MNKEFIRIGAKFMHKDKVFEIIDLVDGSSKTYTGTLVFYKNGDGKLKVKTTEEFVKKFEIFQ
jgi:hypothetical protein